MKQRVRETAHRKIAELEAVLLRRTQLQVPRRFEARATFDTLRKMLVSPSGKNALAYCQSWLQAPDKKPGPLLVGSSGAFKTHLVWATARELSAQAQRRVKDHAVSLRLETERRINEGELDSTNDIHFPISAWPTFNLVVTDGAEIAHEVRSTVQKGNLDEVLTRYRQPRYDPDSAALLVDDVEVMKLSDWLHEELYRIFDYRYQHAMPTLVATNLSGEELRRHLGDRIARRIEDMTEPFEMTA